MNVLTKIKKTGPVKCRVFNMRYILIILLCLIGTAYGQTTGYMRFDSVKFEKVGGNSEFILLNGTRGVTGGVLTNTGNGRTAFVTPSPSGWSLTGNSGTLTPGTYFLGPTSNYGLMFKTNNIQSGYIDRVNSNTSFGVQSLIGNTFGTANSAFGETALSANTTGESNTAIGLAASGNNTTGSYNTSFGRLSLSNNQTGNNNIGIGYSAGSHTGSGNSNRLFINSLDRSNDAGDTTKSIIYGVQNATAGSQRLYFNSQVYLPYVNSGVGTKALRINPGTGIITYADTIANPVAGTGTLNYVSKWASSTTLGNSSITDNGSSVVVTPPSAGPMLEVLGAFKVRDSVTFNGLLQKSDNTDSIVVRDTNGKLGTVSKTSLIPSLTSTQIAFGDGSNLMTSSANFVYDGDELTVKTSGGVARLMTGITQFKAGDVNDAGDGNKFIIDDSGVAWYDNIAHTGHFGINTQSPSVALDVLGEFKLNNATEGAGKVLTSDASGNASWSAVTACATCVTSASSLTANQLMIGAGSQASAVTTTGTGVLTALGVNIGSAGAFVVNGGALGTPSSGTGTNLTGIPEGGLSLTDITTNNTSTSAHGFFPKLTSNRLYYVNNSGALTALAFGTTGKVLTTNGATSDPTWETPGGGGGGWAVTGTTTITGAALVDMASNAVTVSHTTGGVQTNAFRPYKVYAALLTQTGTSAPTATVLENTLGGTVVWARSTTGTYTATLASAFTASKTGVLLGTNVPDWQSYSAFTQKTSTSVITVYTSTGPDRDQSDGALSETFIEIRVYF